MWKWLTWISQLAFHCFLCEIAAAAVWVHVLQNMKPEPGTNSLKLPLSNSWGLGRVVLNVNNESKKMNKNLRFLHSPFPPTITYSCIFPKYCFTRTCVNHYVMFHILDYWLILNNPSSRGSQREIQRYSRWNMQIKKHTTMTPQCCQISCVFVPS